MKLTRILCIVVICLFALPVFAQEPTEATMDTVRDALKAQKRAFVAVNMQMTEQEEAGFWPLYDSYQKELQEINMTMAEIIGNYAKNYNANTLTDEKAKQLLTNWMAVEEKLMKLKTSYLPKFEKAIPAKKVARYYQIESKIQALLRFDMAENIPLVK